MNRTLLQSITLFLGDRKLSLLQNLSSEMEASFRNIILHSWIARKKTTGIFSDGELLVPSDTMLRIVNVKMKYCLDIFNRYNDIGLEHFFTVPAK